MLAIKTPIISQLILDLRFAPQSQKLKQLKAAEQLLSIIDVQKQYPFEFICYKITGFRPQKDAEALISGIDLKDDLNSFITRFSNQLDQKINQIDQEVYSISQLAQKLGVSTRTIERWRKRGLVSRKFIFDDGNKKIGFLQSSVDAFSKQNLSLIERASQFNKVNTDEKSNIISYAKLLIMESNCSRQEVINQIASHFKRSKDTVRRTLLEYESNKKNKPIFTKPAGILSSKEEKAIYQAFQQNISIDIIIKTYHRSKSSIYRIINKRKMRELRLKKIDYIANPEFFSEKAEEIILSQPLKRFPSIMLNQNSDKPYNGKISQYVNAIKSIPPLTRELEVELFRRYNFLKFSAAAIISTFPASGNAPSSKIKKVDAFIQQSEDIRKILIETNMRLVVSIANRHSGWGANVSDLISEGYFSLMHAIEKFDYNRGFRFSTYASLAISKDYARRIPAETSRPDKASSIDIDDVQFDFRKTNISDIIAIEDAHKSLENIIKNNLTEREQYIIINHYGMLESKLKKKYKSLKQIGEEIGLSKERVRQIELLALQKLRQSMSPEEFELLMT